MKEILYNIESYNLTPKSGNKYLEKILNYDRKVVSQFIVKDIVENGISEKNEYAIDLLVEINRENSWDYLKLLIQYKQFLIPILDFIGKNLVYESIELVLNIINENEDADDVYSAAEALSLIARFEDLARILPLSGLDLGNNQQGLSSNRIISNLAEELKK